MWSDTYDGTLADIFDLQERIAREITTKLKVVLAPGSERLVATATASPEAYALFVEAQGLVSRRTDLPHAINLLNRATALDPNFARAWSKLAVANMVAPQYSPLSWKSAWKAGEVAARRALALDPTSAESYAALGYMYLSERRYTDMDAAFTQALALNGHDVTTLYWAANGLTSMGRVAAAEKLLDQILREDPVNALTLQYKGITRFAKGDFAAAQKYSLAGIAAGIKIAHMIPSQIGAEAGTYDSATTDFTIGFGSIISAFNEVDLATIFHGTYADGAARASALAVVNKSSKDVLAPTMYLFISEPSRAFSEFEKSGSGLSDAFLDWLWLPTAYSRLARQHPAFQGFAKRLGMVDYWRKADWPDLCRAAPDRGPDAFTCD
jgi:tetratricopeptide (TPR) repeat protein